MYRGKAEYLRLLCSCYGYGSCLWLYQFDLIGLLCIVQLLAFAPIILLQVDSEEPLSHTNKVLWQNDLLNFPTFHQSTLPLSTTSQHGNDSVGKYNVQKVTAPTSATSSQYSKQDIGASLDCFPLDDDQLALDNKEEAALDKLIGRLLNAGHVQESVQVVQHFNYQSTDLQIILVGNKLEYT